MLHAGERHRSGHSFDGDRCPDCDRVMLPHGGRSVCPECGQVTTSQWQAVQMFVRAFRAPLPPPAAMFKPRRNTGRPRRGQLDFFGREVD